MSDFERLIRSIAQRTPSLSVQQAIQVVENSLLNGAPVPGSPREANAEWAFEQPAIMALINQGKTINAIKELRGLTNMDLRSAKDAVELASQWHKEGRLTKAEQETVDAEAEEAIASIARTMRRGAR